jgi:hypothetical protein
MSDKASGWQVGGSTYDLLRERDKLRAEINDVWAKIAQERNELRVENERLQSQNEELAIDVMRQSSEVARLRSSAEVLVELVQVATMAIAAGQWQVLSSWLLQHADELEAAYVRSNQPLPPEFRQALRELDAR